MTVNRYETTLDEICVQITDGAHNSPRSVEFGLPMASVKDLTPYGINLGTCRHISEEDFATLVRQGCQPKSGDVLIAKDGASALDTVCEIKRPINVVLLSSIAILRPDNSKVTSSYLHYFMDCETTRQYLKSGFITGAAIPRVVLKDFKRCRVSLPPLPTQHKIAAILSAYDDLIENNTRRIAILEEMAQSLYREWFVHFRFPGHEKKRLVESALGLIPEGWEVKQLSEVCSRITDGSHWSPKTVNYGYPMASVKDMHDWGFNIEQCRAIAKEDYETLVRNDCKPLSGDVLIAKDGSYLKHVFVVEKELNIVILSSIAMLRPNDKILPHILSLYLREPLNKARLKSFVSGVAIPRIVLKDFAKFLVLLPPLDIQEQFCKLAGPMIMNCYRLIEKNANLRRTRDLLLPKLISREVDVERLEVDGKAAKV